MDRGKNGWETSPKPLQLLFLGPSHNYGGISLDWNHFYASISSGWATGSSATKTRLDEMFWQSSLVLLATLDCSVSSTPFQNLFKLVPFEIYHSKEAVKHLIQSLSSILLCGILGAKSARSADLPEWTSLSTYRFQVKSAAGLVVVASERHWCHQITHTKSAQSEMNETDNFLIVQPEGCFGAIISMFVSQSPLQCPDRSDRFSMWTYWPFWMFWWPVLTP